jgi:hypothetical protein
MDNDPTPLESSTSSPNGRAGAGLPGWLKLGVVTVGSALAGGLAAAWWYRKTLERLRQGAENAENPDFRIPGGDAGRETADIEGEGL